MSRLKRCWSRPAFVVGGVRFQAVDCALAAMLRGDWSKFERQLAEGLAGAAHAVAHRSGPAPEAIEAAGTAFRYDRDLISAEEMNAWLERSEISVDEWTGYLRRDLLRQTLRDSIDDVIDRHQPTARHLIDTAVAEGVCSRSFDAFEAAFAGRAALVGDVRAHVAPPDEATPSGGAAAQLVHTYPHWLSMLPAADTLARAQRVVAIEAAYDAAVERLFSQTPLTEVVHSHRMEWRLIEIDTVTFATESAGREAVLCMTDEGLSLHDVASLSGGTVERRLHFADEFDADMSDGLLSVDVGGLVGPTAGAGGFEVTRVVRCTPPSAEDPRVAERARHVVTEAAIRVAVRERVTRPHQA